MSGLEKINKAMKDQDLKVKAVAPKVFLHPNTLSSILSGRYKLTKSKRKLLFDVLGINGFNLN